MSIQKKIQHLIAHQLPEFVRADYPQFVTFLEAYYRFLETPGQVHEALLNSSDWTDIDATLDVFIPKFREQFAYDFPNEILIDVRRLIKYIGTYYEYKGTKTGVELFFRMMFNEGIVVSYPGDDILRASDGKWVTQNFIKVDTTNFSNNIFDLEGKQITLSYVYKLPGYTISTPLSEVRTITTNCNSIVGTNDANIYMLEVTLNSGYQFPTHSDLDNVTGKDIDGDDVLETITNLGTHDSRIFIIYNEDVYGRLSKQITKVLTIDVAGSLFLPPDAYTVTQGLGTGIVRVTSVFDRPTEQYFLEDYVEPGYVYIGDDNALAGLRVIDSGYRFNAANTSFQTIINPNDIAGTPSTVTFGLGYIHQTPGYFKDSSGFLSDTHHLFDNDYYQPFSYVLTAQSPLSDWRNTYMQSTHPAGFKMFAELELVGDGSVSVTSSGEISSITPT